MSTGEFVSLGKTENGEDGPTVAGRSHGGFGPFPNLFPQEQESDTFIYQATIHFRILYRQGNAVDEGAWLLYANAISLKTR